MAEIILKTITFKVPDGSLGLSISGGADSAILAWLLMKYTTNPLHLYALAGNQYSNNGRPNLHNILSIIDYCIKNTGSGTVKFTAEYCVTKSRDKLIDFCLDKVDTGAIGTMLSATTARPPDDVISTFKIKLADDISARRNPETFKPLYTHGGKWYHPFINVDKRVIKNIYLEEGVLDSLFPLTRSCEDYTLTTGHCGSCWWCEERFWAFGKLE